MSAEQLQAVRDARERRRPIQRAIRIAGFDAWCTAIFALLSLPTAFFSPAAAGICAGLTLIAAVGFVGRALLRRLDPRGPRLLGFNQLGFFLLLSAYCLWSLYYAFTHPIDLSPLLADDPQLQAMFDDALGGKNLQDLYQQLALAVYGGVILGSALFQGGLSLFYFSRTPKLRAYLEQTPHWIRALDS